MHYNNSNNKSYLNVSFKLFISRWTFSEATEVPKAVAVLTAEINNNLFLKRNLFVTGKYAKEVLTILIGEQVIVIFSRIAVLDNNGLKSKFCAFLSKAFRIII